MTARTALPGNSLSGDIRVAGDKSISHRALMLSALAVGRSTVTGLLEGEDVLATASALRALGARVERLGAGHWQVDGVGVGGFIEAEDILDMGNSGTAARLLIGLLSTHPITSFFTGDASLRRRPMGRIIAPLQATGARLTSRHGGRLPLVVEGARDPMPLHYRLPVASAQVKSAVLLAGLNTPGTTTVIEPEPTRDHTERMLKAMGAEIDIADGEDGRLITLTGQPELHPINMVVPGDPSSAAFPLVAALLTPDSQVTVRNVGVNPTRTGLFVTLAEMGADMEIIDRGEAGGELVADIVARSSELRGVHVPGERAPSMIDEYPILAVAAAAARGVTRLEGIGELRVKESDRLEAVVAGLTACGVTTRGRRGLAGN